MSATAAERAFARHFEASRSERESREPAWLERLREEAFDTFAAQGLPTTRLEDLRSFLSIPSPSRFPPAAQETTART